MDVPNQLSAAVKALTKQMAAGALRPDTTYHWNGKRWVP